MIEPNANKIETSLISEYEAADLLGVTQRSLQTLRLAGRGPRFIRLNERLIRYRIDDILQWLSQRGES